MKVLLFVCIALIGSTSAGILHPATLLHGHAVVAPVLPHAAVVAPAVVAPAVVGPAVVAAPAVVGVHHGIVAHHGLLAHHHIVG